MKRWILAVVLVAAFVFPAQGGEKNYCHDPETEAQWLALLAKNPKDFDLQALHALRMGICIKVEQGVLTLDEGTKIFERARSALIEQKKAESSRADSEGKQNL